MYVKGIICTKGGKGLYEGDLTPVEGSRDGRSLCASRVLSVPMEEKVCLMVI